MVGLGNTIYELVAEPWNGQPFRPWVVEDALLGLDGETNWQLSLVSGPERMVVDEDALMDELTTRGTEHHNFNLDIGHWRVHNPVRQGPTDEIVEPAPTNPVLDRVVAPRRASDLEFQQESGRGSRSEVINPFLEGHVDGCVIHKLGDVVGWKAAFTARYPKTNDIISALVLSRPKARMLDNGDVVEVTRLANHLAAPQNTSSWMLARARKWARNEGFDEMIAYSGVADNPGTCYKATGFELDDEAIADGSGWKRHGDDRETYQGGGKWTRRRWKSQLQASTPAIDS